MTKTRKDVADYMLVHGYKMLVASREEASNSVWVTEDDAPNGEGYYERQIVPLRHRFAIDGRIALLDFEWDNTKYRIRSSQQKTAAENEAYVVAVFFTLLEWIELGLTDWAGAFGGFSRTAAAVDEWWRVLRAPPDASRAEIEGAYKRQVGKAHPDHGGTHEAFLRVRAAYEEGLSLLT